MDPSQMARNPEPEKEIAELEAMQALAMKLEGFGLEEWEIGVLIAKDVGGLTLAEIAEEGGYTSPRAVQSIYKIALAKAKRAYAKEPC